MAQVLSENNTRLDEESIKGKFGWIYINGHYILYIMRTINGERLKFVSMQMTETHLLRFRFPSFNPEMYNFIQVKCHYITNSEARLLNNINKEHCENNKDVYGQHYFISGKDCIVRLDDALRFYKFLNVCYKKIKLHIDDPEIQFGFIRIDSNLVPYLTKNNQKYVPLLCFKGQTNDLLIRSVELNKWDLVYLKFCFKIMGNFNGLNKNDSCTAVSINDIKKYYPPETIYEDFWPLNLINESCIISWTKYHNQPGAWTTHHTEVISVPKNNIPHTLTTLEIPQSVAVTMNAHHNGLANQLGSPIMLQNNRPTNPNLPLIDRTGSVKVITNYQRMPMNKRKECSHLTNLRKFIKISNISHVPQQQSQKPQQQEEKQQTIINHQKRHYISQFVKNKVLQPITITPGTCSEVINPSTTTSNIKGSPIMLHNNSPTIPNLPLIDRTGSFKVITNYKRMFMNKRKESSHSTNIQKFIKISKISHVPQQQSQHQQQQEEKQQTIINHQK